MTLELHVVVKDRETGKVCNIPYYLSGKWAQPGDWLWEYALEEARKQKENIHIYYGHCERAVGGIVYG